MYVVIYNQDNGIPAVLSPAPEVVEALGGGIEAVRKIGVKDVPAGKPFKILEHADLPQDIPQEYWEIDESFGEPDGFGGENNEFDAELLRKYYEVRNADKN